MSGGPPHGKGSLLTGRGQYQVRALTRALRILDLFSLTRPELSLAEIALEADVPKSTAFRLLSVLEEHGYVDRDAEAESYRMGVRPFELGSVYLQTRTIEDEARPHLRRLARGCHQTANLGVLNRGEVLHIAVVPPDRPIHYFASVGDREKPHCTGLGKALISEFDRSQLEDLLTQHPPIRYTDNTITDIDDLERSLAEVRRQGFAFDNEERFAGLKCIAAPVRNDKGEIVAAVSVSGLAPEFGEPELPTFVDEVRNAADAVSLRLGYGVRAESEPAS